MDVWHGFIAAIVLTAALKTYSWRQVCYWRTLESPADHIPAEYLEETTTETVVAAPANARELELSKQPIEILGLS